MKNNTFFTILNCLGLSIGMAGLVFAILYWNDEHRYNDWNPYKENVFLVVNDLGEETIWASSPGPLGEHLKKKSNELEAYCYVNNWYFEEIIQYKEKKEVFKILDAQQNFFDFFPFPFIKGNPKNCLSRSSVAISSETAKKLFGSEDPIHKTIFYAGTSLLVKGVYENNKKSSFAPDVVTNLIDQKLNPNDNPWGNFNFGLLLKLKNPNDKKSVETKIEKLHYDNNLSRWAKDEGLSVEEYLKKYDEEPTKVILEPLKDARLHSLIDSYPEGRGNYQFLMIMMGLSLLIVILTIVNYVNLATANAIKRAKEVGIRKIVGASKRDIVVQFLFETILIAFCALLIALAIVELSLPYYNDFLNKTLVLFGRQFYLYLLVIFLLIVLFAGLFPALYVANFETLKVLKGNFSHSKGGIFLRNIMLILQFAIASFFIIGFTIVNQQVNFIANKDLGFKGEQILQIDYRNPYDYREKDYREKILNRFEFIKNELNKIKGVEKVASGSFNFNTGASSSSSFIYNNINIQGQNMGIDFDMLNLMQIKIKEGRNLSEKFASDTISTMLLNETAARMTKEKNLIGKTVNWNNNNLVVVGIVKDFHVYGPQTQIPPMAFFHFKTIDWMMQNVNKIYVKVNSKDMPQTISLIEKFWSKNVDSEYTFSYDFVDKAYARTFQQYVNQRNLFSLLNITVIAIALFGLFALTTFSLQRRMKEIAIRKTLGAETSELLKELSKQYVMYSFIGFLIAFFPVYYLLDKWLQNFAYRISISWIPFIIGFGILLILTLAVVLSKAYQATKVDVLTYLKYE